MKKLVNSLSSLLTVFWHCVRRFLALILCALAPAFAVAETAGVALNDDDMHWDTRTLSLPDATAAIDAFDRLRPYRELILDRCGLHSINPRLAVLLADAGDVLANVDPASEALMRARLDAFLTALPHMYYLGRKQAAVRAASTPANEAIADDSSNTAGIRALAQTFMPGEARFEALSQRYVEKYGERDRSKSGAPTAPSAAPTNFMRLPWTLGQNGWSFNGVHTTGGGCATPACATPRSSIDFSLGWPTWGSDTSAAQVLAANDGVVTKFSNCNIRVTNGNGWASNYYHLSGALVSTGDTVVVGQPLAIYANNTAEALCQGGSSTGPHVHFSLVSAGALVDIDQSEFSGWRVNSTNVIQDYDSNCTRMYLSRDGSVPCPYNGGAPAAWSMHTLPATMPSNGRCALDIDGNGTADATTDGVLLLRYLLGFRGTALVANAVGGSPQRGTPETIEPFIASKLYDLDGDSVQRGHTDGLLAARVMRGLTGTALSSQAVGSNSARPTGAQIAAFAAGCR